MNSCEWCGRVHAYSAKRTSCPRQYQENIKPKEKVTKVKDTKQKAKRVKRKSNPSPVGVFLKTLVFGVGK